MRIAQVTATYPPYQGGTGNVCHHQALELARRGHDVHVFTGSLAGDDAGPDDSPVAVHRLPVLLQAGNAPLLRGLVRGLARFDVIHLHYPFIGCAELVAAAAAMYHTPLVVSVHNDLVGTGMRRMLFGAYQQVSVRVTLRGASRICAVSSDHLMSSKVAEVAGLHGRDVVEIPNGVDIATFHPGNVDHRLMDELGIPADRKVILFVAALDRAHHFKGLERLLAALPRLSPDRHLVIAGDGDMRPDYEREVRMEGLAGRVTFTGAVGHTRLPALYRRATVTVLPSSPPESFGLVLVESMACGTPVVASRIPGVRTVVNHGVDGFLVSPGDIEDLATSIETIAGDSALHQRMSEAGRRKTVERYDWRIVAERLEDLYFDVRARGRGDTVSRASES